MTAPAEPKLDPCPLCRGLSIFDSHPYRGTGASGMEIPAVSVVCTCCGLSLPKRQADDWTRQFGNHDITDQVRAEMAEQWNRRPDPLAEYAAHKQECATRFKPLVGDPRKCNCGLAELLKETGD